jgi:hypothetical protein
MVQALSRNLESAGFGISESMPQFVPGRIKPWGRQRASVSLAALRIQCKVGAEQVYSARNRVTLLR